jgi:anti-sigma factor RsiW
MLLVAFFKIRYAKSRMVAYINGELPPAARRRIARYIEQYPAVYAEYIHQRNAAREFQWKLPLLGYPEKPALDRIWSAVQAELTASPETRRYPLGLPATNFQIRYGVLGLVMAFVMALPMTFSGNRAAFALSLSQPAPQTATLQPADTRIAPAKGERLIVMLIATEQVDVTPPAPALPQATPVGTEAD